jgi:hypothetical protein
MAEDVLYLESMACDLCTYSVRSKKEKEGGTQHKLMGEKLNIYVYCIIFFIVAPHCTVSMETLCILLLCKL